MGETPHGACFRDPTRRSCDAGTAHRGRKGIEGGDLAQGAAISLFLFPVLAAVAILILRMARRMEVV